jgi:hypothetical protein
MNAERDTPTFDMISRQQRGRQQTRTGSASSSATRQGRSRWVTGYSYEPWHLRFIGVEPSTAIYSSGVTLEEFLGSRGAG